MMPDQTLPLPEPPEDDPLGAHDPEPDAPTPADYPDDTSQNEDYDRIFGQGGAASTAPADEAEISFDPTDADKRPNGWYRAVIHETPVAEISQAGNSMMKVVFQITERNEFHGSLQFRRYMLAGRAGRFTKQFLLTLGLEEAAAGRAKIRPAEMKGREVLIHVQPQKNNADFDEVNEVKPIEE